jgi:hypothetical protein
MAKKAIQTRLRDNFPEANAPLPESMPQNEAEIVPSVEQKSANTVQSAVNKLKTFANVHATPQASLSHFRNSQREL